MDNEQRIKFILIAGAEYFKEQLTENQLRLYTKDLRDLPAASVDTAMERYRNDPKNTRFPHPTMLRSQLSPQANHRDAGIDVARLVMKAVGRHGSYWQRGFTANGAVRYQGVRGDVAKYFDNWVAAAKYELGELGYHTVLLCGWDRLCSAQCDDGILFAQLRDTAEMLCRKAERGDIAVPPALPTNTVAPRLPGGTGLATIGDVCRGLQLKKPE